jgi:phosphoribosylformylglycinamidine synthase
MLHMIFRTHESRPRFEECYYIDAPQGLSLEATMRICWMLRRPAATVSLKTSFPEGADVLEIGPRLSIETAFSSNAVRICSNIGIPVRRIEMSRRYAANKADHLEILAFACDRMTETFYPHPLDTFDIGTAPEPVRFVDILGRGEDALREANRELGLGMDEKDIAYYSAMFARLGRNPTDVELFQIGNGNSEHSRHWFFRGKIVIDGEEMPHTLMELIKRPWKRAPGKNLVAFHDNAGVIHGARVSLLRAAHPGKPSPYHLWNVLVHIAMTAETHNHPTLWEPFQGATTGSGGRIRDNFAVGRGALVSFGQAGYAVGNLHIPGYVIPGEEIGRGQPYDTFASPLSILIKGSDGISDYGNKIGEPLINGVCRTYGQILDGRRTEYLKPVLYTAGLSLMPETSLPKGAPEIGMYIVRAAGPAYRIGVGGGSASSVEGGTANTELDMKSVQRGDPEMENCVNRALRNCVEMGDANPIESIHDQGAGGPSNVITELMEPLGGRVEIRNIVAGDRTMSVLELWVAEYQEGYGLLVRPENLDTLRSICAAEHVNCEVLGTITGDGHVTVTDARDATTPVHLALKDVLGELPQKTFEMKRIPLTLEAIRIPDDLTFARAAEITLKQVSVGSKAHLTHKVDRSVTGLVVRQQHCGPLSLPVGDAAIVALSHFGLEGAATALGEQPLAMLIDPVKGARLAVAEAITNLMGAGIPYLGDIALRANWMWAAKQPGQGARLYDAARAMSGFMEALGVAANGGKDSLSMSVKAFGETVLSPGTLVMEAVGHVPDITRNVTPDFKHAKSRIGYLDLGDGTGLGGSALAQALGQLGDECADVRPGVLASGFVLLQRLTAQGKILSCHDVSDGGLFATIAEMCLSGNRGAHIAPEQGADLWSFFFGQRPGIVFEFDWEDQDHIWSLIEEAGLRHRFRMLGHTTDRAMLIIGRAVDVPAYKTTLADLRNLWESTSTALRMLQASEAQVREEVQSGREMLNPAFKLTFELPPRISLDEKHRPLAAIIREEGSNGDAEMRAAFMLAGFTPVDISMQHIRNGDVASLAPYRVIAFVGGFSYADTFGSAIGWAAGIRFDERVRKIFQDFYARPDTYSLGICNGCQLMMRLGLVPYRSDAEDDLGWMEHNLSGRFESRYPRLRIEKSSSAWLAGMEGSIIGMHSAHGEGRFVLDPRLLARIRRDELIAAVYTDAVGEPTMLYPHNPNGSADGIAALSSRCGRHLAMMPHPERTVLSWQEEYVPPLRKKHEMAPMFKMFSNIRANV